MKCLVTGATGFAGGWLCRYLVEQGHQVVGWGRNPPRSPVSDVRYGIVDITKRSDVREALSTEEPDTVFHLAALANVAKCENYPEAAEAVNVAGTRNIAELLPPSARMVFSSTCHVYGNPLQLPIDETHPCHPVGVYASSKLRAEAIIHGHHPNGVVVRAFHHTGPGQDTAYALADWAHQIQQGATRISVGNIEVRRDYTDVRDVVAGYVIAAEKSPPGETYNLCSGKSHTLREMLHMLIANKPIAISPDVNRFRDVDVDELYGDATKLQKLGWSPKHFIGQTLHTMCQP